MRATMMGADAMPPRPQYMAALNISRSAAARAAAHIIIIDAAGLLNIAPPHRGDERGKEGSATPR